MVTGAIPGLTVNMAVALAVPLTLSMSPVASIMMLLGLYCSGVYGGSVSAILLNAPGTPASAATSTSTIPTPRGVVVSSVSIADLFWPPSTARGVFTLFPLFDSPLDFTERETT